MTTDRGKSAALALAIAALALVPATAGADTPRTQLPNCAGKADPAGDAKIGAANVYSPAAADASQDITGAYFTPHVDENGYSTGFTATLNVPGLTATPPPYSFGIDYRLFFTDAAGTDRYYEVENFSPPGLATALGALYIWDYGHYDATGSAVSDGTGSGDYVVGPDGHITLNLPPDLDPRSTISAITWQAATDEGAIVAKSDGVPDTGSLSYDGSKCPPVVDPPEAA
jgi:hypothetical protein